MKPGYNLFYNNVRLRPLEHADIEPLRRWRNDAASARFLRPMPPITPEGQEAWFQASLADTGCHTFAIDETETLHRAVGSISLYNFDGNTAEYGRLMVGDPDAPGRGVGCLALILCLHYGFACLCLDKITASVHWENYAALANNMKVGFFVTGHHPFDDDAYELEITIKRERYDDLHTFLPRVQVKG